MKKIRVSGCCNCPYVCRTKNTQSETDSEAKHLLCGHPSFHTSTSSVYMPSVDKYVNAMHDVEKLNPASLSPDWCPLEYDVTSVCTCGSL